MGMTDQLAAAILDKAAKLELRVPVVWEDRGTALRTELSVHNSHGRSVWAGMQITKDKPWKPTVYLMTDGIQLRRLDVNGSHTNRTLDRTTWKFDTHKHQWSEAHRDAYAYTPTGIPNLPFENVTGADYRAVFEAFLDECEIVRGQAYHWSDPDFGRMSRGE